MIDWAIQAHGGGGVCDDFGLAYAYAHARTLRLADGPDEVHRNQIAKLELRKYSRMMGAGFGRWKRQRTAERTANLPSPQPSPHGRGSSLAAVVSRPLSHGGEGQGEGRFASYALNRTVYRENRS